MKSRKVIQLVAWILLASTIASARAVGAEIAVVKDRFGKRIVAISGEIGRGDLQKLSEVAANLVLSTGLASNTLQFHLNTSGGDVEEAMRIGRFFRTILASVDSYGTIVVAPGSTEAKSAGKDRDIVVLAPDERLGPEHLVKNYSAGILMFYGGVQRGHRDNGDRRLGFHKQISIPVMGIHRPYYEKKAFAKLSPAEAAAAYSQLERSVRKYLAEMGAPQSIIDRMFNAASNQIELISDDEFRQLYRFEESFQEEWLIAKCGATGHYESVLDAREMEDFKRIERAQISCDRQIDIYRICPSDDFSQPYQERLYRLIRNHNRGVDNCRRTAITDHQQEWARKFLRRSP